MNCGLSKGSDWKEEVRCETISGRICVDPSGAVKVELNDDKLENFLFGKFDELK